MQLARADDVLDGRANPDGTACLWIGLTCRCLATVYALSLKRERPLSASALHLARAARVTQHPLQDFPTFGVLHD